MRPCVQAAQQCTQELERLPSYRLLDVDAQTKRALRRRPRR
jgi:hypothetical protein